jgi:hypothetical protein
MATRMTTLLYGDRPGIDVEPGNRVDSESPSGPSIPSPPPMRPTYPTPSPWVRREQIAEPPPRGLRTVLGVAAASLVAACIAYVASTRRVNA